MKVTTPRLTTHVLDTARGCPAEGVRIELWSLDGPQPCLLKPAGTTADGRPEQPLLTAEEMRAGLYELLFHAGDYFLSHATASTDSVTAPFLDRIPVRFRITDASVSYHIPLLMSPWCYTTYRGS